jgi:DnaJ-class molecular chaperone
MPPRVRYHPCHNQGISKFALRNCSKFPNNPDATYAFQKVAVAYDILSKPSSKRLYDNRSPTTTYDVFAARPSGHAEETFRGVVLGVLNDFLDGDLEVIRTLLSTSFSP